ncbi:pseudouridine synthase [Comamonas piscis]|uniref:tRNA pseudouridine synthase C n=1 Tax=Comamonas piscis TaxID=1562974 RepID=A0A7G5EKF8_9BURK|nr:pseudouridine synthase [Comamonas piscis]QMV74483.1 pseudouridine synthase [Comamonas piscis]WSO32938.1 pseudouridine synthase [Comamonas piscis]
MPMIPASVAHPHAQDQPLPVLWRDEHLIAIYKPAQWLVHRTGLDAGETRFIVQTLRDQIGKHVFPLHRLDKGTCGVLLLALHAEAASRTRQQFENHQIGKRYLAMVRGWAPLHAEVDHALRPDDAPEDAAAQPAQTRFARLATLEHADTYDARFAGTRLSLVQAEPHTGRRHQIRRHLKHIAHPIIGDATHGKGPLNRWWAERLGLQRLWLHAWSLSLQHPYTQVPLQIESGLQFAPVAPQPASASAPGSGEPQSHPSLQQWQALLRSPQWSRD